jgi:small subunit ribosomal protein S16
MLAIRMQRTGRKGHAMFRVIVQDSRLTPTSGKVVAQLGSYDPHAKTITLDKEKATFYLGHGAQPSGRVTRLLKSEGVKLPDWVKLPADKERAVRNAGKRRSTRPPEEAKPVEEAKEEVSEAPAPEAAEAEEATVAEVPEESAAETAEAAGADVPAEETEAPAAEATVPEDTVADKSADTTAEAPPAEPAEDKPAETAKDA